MPTLPRFAPDRPAFLLSGERLLKMLGQMHLIRAFEEAAFQQDHGHLSEAGIERIQAQTEQPLSAGAALGQGRSSGTCIAQRAGGC